MVRCDKHGAFLADVGRYPKQNGPLAVGPRQISEILYFGPLKPGSPWEALKVVLKCFVHANNLDAPMRLFTGSCKVGVFTAKDVPGELFRQIPHLRRKHPTRSLVIQTGPHGEDHATDPVQYALLTVVSDSKNRTILLDGMIQFSTTPQFPPSPTVPAEWPSSHYRDLKNCGFQSFHLVSQRRGPRGK